MFKSTFWLPLTCIAASIPALPSNAEPIIGPVTKYVGGCDASGAVAISDDGFLVVDNEEEAFRIYRIGQPEPYEPDPDFRDRLGFEDSKRADFEGVARIDDLIFIIGSHSDTDDAELRPNRRILFAVRVSDDGSGFDITLAGHPQRNLRAALDTLPEIQGAAGRLNIEGLAATPDGQLLLGFRTPLFEDGSGKKLALVVPITNPNAAIEGSDVQLGPVSRLDLGERGIRSLEYDSQSNSYFISGGGDDGLQLFSWHGPGSNVVMQITGADWLSGANDFTPESIFFMPKDPEHIHLLSDDGEVQVNGQECKDLQAGSEKGFRGFAITTPDQQ